MPELLLGQVSDEEMQTLANEYSLSDISLLFCRTTSRISRELKNRNIDHVTRYRKTRNTFRPDKKTLEDLYIKQNMSLDSIKDKYNVSQSTVFKWTKTYGLKKRRGNGFDANMHKIMCDLSESMTVKEIAEEMGCSTSVVYVVLKQNGFDTLRKPLFSDNDELVCQMYKSKIPLSVIAERIGSQYGQIKNILVRNNITSHTQAAKKLYDKIFTRQYMVEQYVNRRKTVKEIAEENGCCKGRVRNKLREFDILIKRASYDLPYNSDEEKLICKYYKQGLGAYVIAKKLNRKYPGAVYIVLKKHNIICTRRSINNIMTQEYLVEKYITQNKSIWKIAEEIGCAPVSVKSQMDKHGIKITKRATYNMLTHEYLTSEYVVKKKSQGEIARECGCDANTVRNRLAKHGIPTRKQDIPVIRQYGIDEKEQICKMWKDGDSIEEIAHAIGRPFPNEKISVILTKAGLRQKYESKK